jgi:hypothetical protein
VKIKEAYFEAVSGKTQAQFYQADAGIHEHVYDLEDASMLTCTEEAFFEAIASRRKYNGFFPFPRTF